MGDKGQPITMNTRFVVFPVRIAAVVVFLGLILYMMRKRLGKAMKVLFG
jgi:F0F1-type ATP synthase membrane subunit b/b'